MDKSGGNDGNGPRNSTNDFGDLSERMAKLWWRDIDQEAPGRMGLEENSPFKLGNNGHGNNNHDEGIWVTKAKYLASVSLHSTLNKIWAKELFEMDSREREDINNEIHGVQSSRTIQETPDIIADGIRLLRKYIDESIKFNLDSGENMVTPVAREAYERVLASELEEGGDKVPYFHTQKLLIKFLRASYFDVEKAAERYFRWFDMMYDLFGDIGLKRPLMMSDLTAREKRYLKKGQMQLLPCRDRVGRRIFTFMGREDLSFTVPEKYRVCMYLFDVCSEDETTQKLGVVWINQPILDSGEKPFGDEGMVLRPKKYEGLGGRTEQEHYRAFVDAKPLRTSGLHVIGADTLLYKMGKALLLLMMGKCDRKIVRFHNGSQLECLYRLRSFGIPSDELPIKDDGQIKNKKVAKFIAARKSIEAIRQQQHKQGEDSAGMSIGTECPEVDCIMFGSRALCNSANLEFRNILKVMERDREEKVARCESSLSVKEFIGEIIRMVKHHNLRFVAINKEMSLFVEIEDGKELHTAVSQALRDQRKRMRLERRIQEQPKHDERTLFSSIDFGSGASGSIIGFDAAKRHKASTEGCCS